MNANRGGVIAQVDDFSPAAVAGIEPGDVLLEINGKPIRDRLDYDFYSIERNLVLTIRKSNEILKLKLKNSKYEEIGLHFNEDLFDGIRECSNCCEFCFVHQLPPGLRKSLYIMDDDFRLSFLHGSYITATNLTAEDKLRIVEQRISPLYISVHSTNDAVRRKLLGCPDAPPIMDELRWFSSNGITIHTQVVVCPGINDGPILEKTIADLSDMHPCVATLAIVPVGLTSHRAKLTEIRPVDSKIAGSIIKMVSHYQKMLRPKLGTRFVWASDELYLLAGKRFPSSDSYEDFSQYENGVGLVREWLDLELRLFRKIRSKTRTVSYQADIVTGILAAPIMSAFADKLSRFGVKLHVHPIKNQLLGESITVSGLISGRDIISQIKKKIFSNKLIIPQVALRDGRFLDDLSLEDLERALGTKVYSCYSSPEELYSLAANDSQNQTSFTPGISWVIL